MTNQKHELVSVDTIENSNPIIKEHDTYISCMNCNWEGWESQLISVSEFSEDYIYCPCCTKLKNNFEIVEYFNGQ